MVGECLDRPHARHRVAVGRFSLRIQSSRALSAGNGSQTIYGLTAPSRAFCAWTGNARTARLRALSNLRKGESDVSEAKTWKRGPGRVGDRPRLHGHELCLWHPGR